MSAEFDSILVRVEIGGSRKLRRFTPEERWCVVAGVWALAGKSPVRGHLLIADGVKVELEDIAEQAGVRLAVAKSTLQKLRDLGMLEVDEELGVECVHDWHLHQPEPKPSETRAAWRERKRRQRDGEREESRYGLGQSAVTVPRDHGHDVTPPREEKRSKGTPPKSPNGGRKRDRERFEEDCRSFAAEEFPGSEAAPRYVAAAISEGLRAPDEIRSYVERWSADARAGAAA